MLIQLLEEYIRGSISADRERLLFEAIQEDDQGIEVQAAMQRILDKATPQPDFDVNRWKPLLQQVFDADKLPLEKKLKVSPFGYIRKTGWLRYAAVLLLIAGMGGYLWLKEKGMHNLGGSSREIVQPLSPGGDKATLMLADGTIIRLDSAADGSLARQGGVQIVKLNSGRLAYEATIGHPGAEPVAFNTLRTPRGGQYQVVLPDGSNVWLNAGSSIRFPTVFSGNYRKVELTGEAYFEIAKDKLRPFTVSAYNINIEVSGTHFNVNAYEDEATITTTLLEGAVKVITGASQKVLKPGEQAAVFQHAKDSAAGGIQLQVVNPAQAVAWKNGLFSFNKADVKTVMRQLARWYDVDIIYEGTYNDILFTGEMQRSLPLPSVLNFLAKSQVKFKITNRKIIVL